MSQPAGFSRHRRAGLVLVISLALAACAAPRTGPDRALSSPPAPAGWLAAADEPAPRQRARLHLALALAYYEQDQSAVALDELQRGLLLDPDFGPLHTLQGLAFQRVGEPVLAHASLQRALALNPQDPDALHNLAWVLCLQARHGEGLPLFERAVALPAAPAKTWMGQGLCQKQAGQSQAAEQSLHQAHRLAPDDALVRYHLAQLLVERSDWRGARAHLAALNAGPTANAQTLWLGLRVEHRLDNQGSVIELAKLLRSRFGSSAEALAYEKGLFR